MSNIAVEVASKSAVNTGKVAPIPSPGIAVVNVYSFYDVCGMVFMEPFYLHYDSQAVRRAGDILESKESMISKHPSDFKLFRIGTYDYNVGLLTPCVPPVFICEVNSLTKENR